MVAEKQENVRLQALDTRRDHGSRRILEGGGAAVPLIIYLCPLPLTYLCTYIPTVVRPRHFLGRFFR